MSSKRPLNYMILKYYTTVDEASVDDVTGALASDYADYAAFNKPRLIEALMTAEKNGLIEESRFDLDDAGEVRVFYRATQEQRDTINSYIK
ncbi:hypothetical protein [Thermophilibacter immobilis]|jgi:DNA-binding PadR family transcriptional regulator|uniref:Uncharacterized protein n=1 Tax=Thermophilibacter immobilis TaxID=2779519 RepID=A0A7S7M982_9ACTN|nr:hypothetical protein [Thermophilibacter immobilis]QOY61059.1 hypothetical protein INP52_02295 [Thermophilibacter immobilis]